MRIVRFFLSFSFSLLFSTICMRLLTAAVTFTANCNSCHKIFHGTPLPTTYTSPTPMVQQAIGMRNKGNCCKLSCSHVETLKKIHHPLPHQIATKLPFFACWFRFLLLLLWLLLLFLSDYCVYFQIQLSAFGSECFCIAIPIGGLIGTVCSICFYIHFFL